MGAEKNVDFLGIRISQAQTTHTADTGAPQHGPAQAPKPVAPLADFCIRPLRGARASRARFDAILAPAGAARAPRAALKAFGTRLKAHSQQTCAFRS